jgi:hypothetical protein
MAEGRACEGLVLSREMKSIMKHKGWVASVGRGGRGGWVNKVKLGGEILLVAGNAYEGHQNHKNILGGR